MAVSIVMPALEMAQETGKILSWLKREGDAVTKGEQLIEIETDKVVFEVEAPEDGVLAGVRQPEGAVVPVGEIIAWIVAPGEQPPDVEASQSARTTTEPARSKTPAAPSASAGGPGAVSPRARRMAQELGVDLATVIGTGPRGTITSDDIVAAAKKTEAAPAPPPPATPAAAPLSAVARLMAERTAQAWNAVPHFFLSCDVDMTALLEARGKLIAAAGAGQPVRVTITDFLIALVGRVLRKHEKMNSSWSGATITPNPEVNISLAIAVKDGVVGAVIRGADTASAEVIGTHRQDLVERARANQLRLSDVEGGTFTISNLGMYGVDSFQAIVMPPQAGILAIGRIADRVVALEGKPAVRPMMTLTLSSDHRVADGAQAALFLKDVCGALGDPQAWLS